MPAHVMIGFAEAIPAPEVFFDLRAAGHRISCFAREGADLPALRHLPFEEIHFVAPPERDCGRAIADLALILGGFGGVVLALDDTGLWLVNRALAECSDPPASAGAQGDAAEIALDKRRQIAAAQKAGLAVPPTRLIHSPAEVPQDIAFPAIVKPSRAIDVVEGRIRKGDVHYLMDDCDLAAFLAGLRDVKEPLLMQPLIRGRGEGVFGFRHDGRVSAWSGHFRVRMMNPHGSGSSACQSLSPDLPTRDKIASFLQEIDWHGPFMMEFLRDDDDTLWFMELNGRMWGSLALARRAGYSYPAWAVARSGDPGFVPPDVPAPQQPLTVRHLGRDLLHLAFVLRGPKSAFHKQGWPGFWKSFRGVLAPGKRSGFYNFDSEFPGFFWKDAIHEIRRKLFS